MLNNNTDQKFFYHFFLHSILSHLLILTTNVQLLSCLQWSLLKILFQGNNWVFRITCHVY